MAWSTLRHPNVLSLLGVTMTEGRLVMVSEWMVKGNINEFVKADPKADRLKLVCFCPRSLFSLVTDDYAIAVAWRRHRGIDLHAWRGCDPWGSQRGTFLNRDHPAVAYPSLRPTS